MILHLILLFHGFELFGWLLGLQIIWLLGLMFLFIGPLKEAILSRPVESLFFSALAFYFTLSFGAFYELLYFPLVVVLGVLHILLSSIWLWHLAFLQLLCLASLALFPLVQVGRLCYLVVVVSLTCRFISMLTSLALLCSWAVITRVLSFFPRLK